MGSSNISAEGLKLRVEKVRLVGYRRVKLLSQSAIHNISV